MDKAILLSIRPEWCEKIASGRKTMELRRGKPKLPEPFKCYIYCTGGGPYLNRHNGKLYFEEKDFLGGRGAGLYERLSGRVIGEFVCDRIMRQCQMQNADLAEQQSLVKRERIFEYANGKEVYGWHISNLKIYGTSKPLSEFHRLCTPACNFSNECGGSSATGCLFGIERPPQSWCYVEDAL